MKKIIWLLILCFGFGHLMCQILVTPQIPLIGVVVKNQLWSLSINNSGRDGMVQIEMSMTDLVGKQQVLTAVSRSFMLFKGAHQVQPGDLMPITYTVMNSSYPVDASPNGFLPVGQFSICYRAVRVDADAHEPTPEQCVEVQIEPLAPPMLISPADNEQIEMPRPQFNWLPPVTNTLFMRLVYELRLVEVLGNQTAAEAVQQNIPLLISPYILGNNLQYPLSSPALDTSKIYAWQVVAKNNSLPIATSEVWAFSLKKPPVEKNKPIAMNGFIKLSRQQEAAFGICYGRLRCEYLNETNTNSVQLFLADITKSPRQEISMDSATYPVKFGENLLELNLDKTSGMVNKHVYLFELVNALNEHWYLKFEYRKPD